MTTKNIPPLTPILSERESTPQERAVHNLMAYTEGFNTLLDAINTQQNLNRDQLRGIIITTLNKIK